MCRTTNPESVRRKWPMKVGRAWKRMRLIHWVLVVEVVLLVVLLVRLPWDTFSKSNGRASLTGATRLRYGMLRSDAEKILGPPIRVLPEGGYDPDDHYADAIYSEEGWGSTFVSQDSISVSYYDGRVCRARVERIWLCDNLPVLTVSQGGTFVRNGNGTTWRKVAGPITGPLGEPLWWED